MIQIPLTKGQFALIDDEMNDRLSYFKWCTHKSGRTWYVITNIKTVTGKWETMSMHRIIMGIPDSRIDHRDNNGLNCQKYNLRLATSHENNWNAQKKLGTTSKYKGVAWYKQTKKWCSKIHINGENKHLGYFLDETEAAITYNNAAIKYFGEFAKLNIITN